MTLAVVPMTDAELDAIEARHRQTFGVLDNADVMTLIAEVRRQREAAKTFIAALGAWLDRNGYDWADLRDVDVESLEPR